MEQLGKQKRNLLLFVVSFFGSGLISNKMPGTIGSVFATLILLVLPKTTYLTLILSVATFFIGWLFCELYIPKYETNRDPGYIVIDEACGIFLGASLIYAFGLTSIFAIIGNLFLFRFFDIWKPFPIRNIEKYLAKNSKTIALGIMLDDMIAAFFGTAIQIALIEIFQDLNF